MVYHVTCFAKVSLLLLKSCSIRVIITFRFIIKNLAHVFNTSSAWQFYVFQDVLKTSCKDVLKTSWRPLARRLEDVLEDEILLRWIRLEHMSCRCVQDMFWRRLEDMSWRCLQDMSWRPLKDLMETNKILIGGTCILISG